MRAPLATDYSALVCVFLNGGNDAWNTIVNLDEYSAYAATRSAIAIPQANLCRSRRPSDGRALRPAPEPGHRAARCSGTRAAGGGVNVGPLLEPIDRAST